MNWHDENLSRAEKSRRRIKFKRAVQTAIFLVINVACAVGIVVLAAVAVGVFR